jgi:serine/threonine protein kinase
MKTIGKYIVRGLLGRGGMSRVYLAEIPVIHRLVALKQLQPNPTLFQLIQPDQARQMFIAEARAMSLLQHRHVVDIWDFEDGPDHVFYTMEYHATTLGTLMGESMHVEAPSRRMAVDAAIRYTLQIIDGLSALHASGIVHRDIKPFNILITKDGQAKIGDFGLSRLHGERFKGPRTLKLGSPYYAAPEQADHPDKADARSDLYATAVVLYRMLTGRLPQGAASVRATDTAFMDEAWSAFFQKALHPIPENRFSSADEMGHALHALSGAWESLKESICSFEEKVAGGENKPAAAMPPRGLRHQAVRILDAKRAQSLFGATSLWEPERYYPHVLFEKIAADLVADRRHGLLWQRRGSPQPLSWQAAHGYVAHLNAVRFGNRTTWRIPTVNELMTLLAHPPTDKRHYCTPAVFDPRQSSLWSCDRRSYTSAYVVHMDLGFISWQDQRATAEVRAVSGPQR